MAMPSRAPKMRAISPARVGFLNVMVLLLSVDGESAGSQRRCVGLAGADAHRRLEVEDEDLAVPDLAGFRRPGDGFDGLVDLLFRDRDLDLDLRQEAHGVFGTAVDFSMALLTPITFDLRDGHPVHAGRGESVADLVELEWLDDGHDDFHGYGPRLGPACGLQVQAVSTRPYRAKLSSPRAMPRRQESSRVPSLG